ncbi:hypothetical protein D9M72_384800 [compost metagenome]
MDLRRGAHVHAPGRLRHDQYLRAAFDLAADNEFLQVAARQAARQRLGPAGLDAEAADHRRGQPGGGLGRDHAPPHVGPRLVRQQDIGGQAHARHGAAAQAFFRHEGQAGAAALACIALAHQPAAELHRYVGRARVFARQRCQQFLLAVTGDPRNADDFARMHVQRNPVQLGGEGMRARQRQLLHAQPHRAAKGSHTRLARGLAADHQARQRGRGFLARIAHASDLAHAHHGGLMAQRADLVELVADVEDAGAFGGQLAQRDEECFHRLRRQHRGGFVQDQQLRIGQQRAHDLHALALADRQRMHMAVRLQRQAIALGGGADALGQLLHVALLPGGQAERDVLGHGQGVEQREMLEHHGDAQVARIVRAVDRDWGPVEAHLAGIGPDGAEDDLHQRGFAGAVLAQDGVDLAGCDGEADVVVGNDARIALADMGKRQPGRGL